MTPIQGAERFHASFKVGPSIMGVLNVTPDSFYDGGTVASVSGAVERASEMLSQGAAIIDIGGESTRPGHRPVGLQEEVDRVVPVIESIARELDTPISIDTTKADVARVALQAGAHIVNDIWGLQHDPDMAGVIAEFEAGAVLMHNRSRVDADSDIVADISQFLARSIDLASQAGIPRAHLVLDPGIGFGKTQEQNCQILSGLKQLNDLGLPILVGVSRKSFIGHTIGDLEADRLPGTIAANLRAIDGGANIIRVHDVGAHSQALKIWEKTAT